MFAKTTTLFAVGLLSLSSAHAATSTYTSQSNFFAAMSAENIVSTTENFEGYTAGDTITNGTTANDITYSYSLDVDLSIENEFATTSGRNYLGTNDGFGVFVGGDSFTLTFSEIQHAFGLYVISDDIVFDDDYTITTDTSGVATNVDIPDVSLIDGDAFYIGLIDTAGFTSITFSSVVDLYEFNIDDITVGAISEVPVPAAGWLFGSGLLFLSGLRRFKRNV